MPARPRSTPSWLKALGRLGLPKQVTLPGGEYALERVFKHDFFAATGLYQRADGHRVVVKFGRQADLLGLPAGGLGRWLAGREARIYRALADLPEVPAFAGRCGPYGFAHDFVPGSPLQRGAPVGAAFFDRLENLIGALHARGMAYVDLEKCGNIIIGEDRRPHLIDFQISWYLPGSWGSRPPLSWIRGMLQHMDRYHLVKHRRRNPTARAESDRAADPDPPAYIKIHRAIARPLQRIRRGFLRRVDPERGTDSRGHG